MTKAVAMPKKMGNTENPPRDFFLVRLLPLPGFWVPARRASPVRMLPVAPTPGVRAGVLARLLALFTTLLMVLPGASLF